MTSPLLDIGHNFSSFHRFVNEKVLLPVNKSYLAKFTWLLYGKLPSGTRWEVGGTSSRGNNIFRAVFICTFGRVLQFEKFLVHHMGTSNADAQI